MPGGGAGRVGQRNEVKPMLAVAHLKNFADDLVETAVWQELFNREFADRDDQLRFEDFDFAFEPGRAVLDFLAGGDTVTTGFFLAGKTTANRSHVNAVPKLFFGETC